jgi:hypothetical protein
LDCGFSGDWPPTPLLFFFTNLNKGDVGPSFLSLLGIPFIFNYLKTLVEPFFPKFKNGQQNKNVT